MHSQRAMALGRSGRMTAARTELDRAVRLLDRLSPRDQWVVTINRGMVRSHLFDLAGARRDFARARDVAHDAAMADQEFMATHNLGYAEYLAGDMPSALRLMAEAERLTSDVWAPARLDRGRVLLEAGLASEAEAVLTGALAVCTDRRQHQVRGEIELDLARARWAVGRDADAVRLARGAQRRFEAREAPLWADRARLLALEVSLSRKGSNRQVAAAATALADRATADDDALLAAHAHLIAAQALVAGGDSAGAARLMGEARPIRRQGSLSARLSLDLVEAHVAAARGEGRTAGTVLRARRPRPARRPGHLGQPRPAHRHRRPRPPARRAGPPARGGARALRRPRRERALAGGHLLDAVDHAARGPRARRAARRAAQPAGTRARGRHGATGGVAVAGGPRP